MGGKDIVANLVSLTASEHFVAHQLLAKMYPNEKGIIYAVYMMTISVKNYEEQRMNNKLFEWIRKAKNEASIGVPHSEERKENISKAMTGRTLSEEHKKAIGKGVKGSVKSEDAKKRIGENGKKTRDANRATLQKSCPHCQKLLDPCNFDRHLEPCKKKQELIKARNGRKKIAVVLTCPHCAKVGIGNTMYQWHFDKCKRKS